MGIHLLGFIGLLLALVGAAMILAPGPLRFALRLLGIRRDPHGAGRVAAWGLIVLGLVIVVLTRAVR
jgi:hypothetical protein